MKKIIVLLLVLVFSLSTVNLYAGVPHVMYIEIFDASGNHPAAHDLIFEAWIVGREAEILTETSPGCDWSVTIPGFASIQVGNFPTPWAVGEIFHLEATQTSTGNSGFGEWTLTSEPYQYLHIGCGWNADFTAEPTSGNYPLTVHFTDESTTEDSIFSWHWDFQNDGTTDSYEQNPTYIYNEEGTYDVYLWIWDGQLPPGSCGDVEIKENYITVHEQHNPEIFVTPDSLNFGKVWVDSTATLPIWVHNVGDTTLSVSNIVSSTDKFTVSLPQTRDISFTVASMDSQQVNIQFAPTETVDYSANLIFFSNDPENGTFFTDVYGSGYVMFADFEADQTTGDIPFEVTFIDSSVGDIISWLWDFGDGDSSTVQNPVHTYTNEGNYNVALTVEDENNSSTITKENYIQAVAHPKIYSPDSLGFNFGTIYVNEIKGDSVIIIQNTGTDTLLINNLSLTNNSSAFIYNYNNLNNPILPTGQDTIFVSFNPINAQTFFDSLLIQNNSENNPDLKIPLQGNGIEFYANFGAEPLTGEVPLEVCFTDSSSGFIEDWFWDFGDGNTSNLQNPTHTYQYDGFYTVSLTVEDDSLIDSFTREKYIHAIGHSKIFTSDSLGFDFGTIYLSEVSEDSVLLIKNIGTDTLLISGLNFVNSNSGFNYTYNLNTPILPTEEDTILINFGPSISQTYFDSLLIQNNSENIPELKIPLEGIGLAFYANFGAEPLTGDVPLEVCFTDSSSGFIEDWFWDFGDGDTSNLQNPTHTYQYDGSYTVSLTVEDDYHTDTFVRENYINAIGHPLITSTDTLGINYGIVYLSDTSGDSLIVIENTGTDTVFVSGLSFTNYTDGFNYNYPDSEEVLLPTEIDTIYVNFEPEVAQNYYDTLLVENNSENIPELKIPLIGIGEYVPPAPPTGVNIDIDSVNAVIYWNAVDTTIYGTPITPDGYVVLYNEIPEDEYYWFLDFTTDTTYTHTYVAQYRTQMYYEIVAIKDHENETIEFIKQLADKKEKLRWVDVKSELNF